MWDQDSQPRPSPEPTPRTQLTQPKGIDPKTSQPYEPVEIPVLDDDEEFEKLVRRAVKDAER